MSEPRPAPYPADTRARGWRFELDYERIDQSDTWGLAAEIPMAQPALLMMWLVAWTREPCGSLPADENVIRAKCRIPAAMWPKLRGVLMRGWWLAEDGLLYHDTLTKRVQEMLDYRRKNAERVAKFKAAQREQREGNALPTREQQVKNDTGTGTGTGTEEEIQEPSALVDEAAPPPRNPCPTDRIVALYHEHLPMLSRVEVINDARRRSISARWREVIADPDIRKAQDPREAALDFFAWFFGHVATSAFLTGRSKDWRADIDFLMAPTKFARVVEGSYHREGAKA